MNILLTSHQSLLTIPRLRSGFTLIALALGCFALYPTAHAVSPPPDGGYAGGNTAEGQNALLSLTGGTYNTAVGFDSLLSITTGKFCTAIGGATLLLNTADSNTAIGAGALLSNATGTQNTANGAFALFANNGDPAAGEASYNCAFGAYALFANTTGAENTALGWKALESNTTGETNTAVGEGALLSNTEGTSNTASGVGALAFNTTGGFNTANGLNALSSNVSGTHNTAIGASAVFTNTVGDMNTAVGGSALLSNTDGGHNTAAGYAALFNNTGSNNTAIGGNALAGNSTGSNNTALGDLAGSNLDTGDNNIDIGYNVVGVAGESNTIRIGNTDIADTFIRGISGATVASGAAVLVAANGHVGTMTSSKRFKDDIKPMDKASEALFSLKPVTFRYKKELDPTRTSQFGLVAEDVEKVNPDLVVRDENGKVNSVRYEQVNAMLLNEFFKEHRKVGELEAALDAVNKRLNEQEARIQKVSAKLEVSKPATNMALNSQ
jgi:hypothetical protein